MRKVIVGSRRSQLALTQTNWVIDRLKELKLPFAFEVKEFVTKGDRILDVTLSKIGGKGLFVKEIEQALLDREIDFAVHSMKDMPAELPEGLVIGCVPERIDVRDALITREGIPLEALPQGAIIGTSSLRRQAQLLAYRPDLTIVPLRGNIDTRLRKLTEENLDGIVLAAAGLDRMGWLDRVTQFLPVEVSLPAIGQGALAIECRADDAEILEMFQHLNDPVTVKTTTAERAFLDTLEGGCQVPIAAYARVNGEEVELTGLVASPDGKQVFKHTSTGANSKELGINLAQQLRAEGAEEILKKVKEAM